MSAADDRICNNGHPYRGYRYSNGSDLCSCESCARTSGVKRYEYHFFTFPLRSGTNLSFGLFVQATMIDGRRRVDVDGQRQQDDWRVK